MKGKMHPSKKRSGRGNVLNAPAVREQPEHPYFLEKRTPVDFKVPPPAPSDKLIFKYWIPDKIPREL
jgi:hypothetical protein